MTIVENASDNASIDSVSALIGQVCAICITYHPDANLLERLLKILRQVPHLVVVDNGSSAAVLSMLGAFAKDDRVTLIPCNKNLGVARGLNIGVERAVKLGYAYALLLDQDTDVYEDLVAVLVAIYQLHPDRNRLAIVGAGYEGSEQLRIGAVNSDLQCEEVEAVITSGSLLSLKAFQNIGPFREEFFIDYVDNEYCARARKRNYLVLQSQRTLMRHAIGNPSRHRLLWVQKLTRNHSAERLYYQARNDTVLLRESGKYRSGGWRLKALRRAVRRCKKVILFESHKVAKVFAVLHGCCDGMRGRLGQRYGDP
jgi:rhamnosyltransferase